MVVLRERLWPRWWVWLVLLVLDGLLAWAYGAALGVGAGLAVFAGGAVLVVLLVWMSAPVIEITTETLRVGPATISRSLMGTRRSMSRADIATATGPGSDARLYVELRPWAATGGVMISINDEADPHPGWLFSSRDPDGVLRALSDTMGPPQQDRSA